eukprot:scaffold48854_cov63-Phaeocystis_antarctica.AAC.3
MAPLHSPASSNGSARGALRGGGELLTLPGVTRCRCTRKCSASASSESSMPAVRWSATWAAEPCRSSSTSRPAAPSCEGRKNASGASVPGLKVRTSSSCSGAPRRSQAALQHSAEMSPQRWRRLRRLPARCAAALTAPSASAIWDPAERRNPSYITALRPFAWTRWDNGRVHKKLENLLELERFVGVHSRSLGRCRVASTAVEP